jgi:hypothetical protein
MQKIDVDGLGFIAVGTGKLFVRECATATEIVHGSKCVRMETLAEGEAQELDPALICGKRTLQLQHGYLCGRHYGAQVDSMPKAKPKKQPDWKDPFYGVYVPPGLLDCQLVADAEADRIAKAKINRIRCGVPGFEPLYLKVLEQ